MAVWKQLILALVIVAAAAAGWAYYFPGAREILSRWGIEWAQASAPAAEGQVATGQRQAGGRRPGGQLAPEVVAAPVRRATINDRLNAIGTGQANASVTVNPFEPGRIAEILVKAGNKVEADQVLAQLDADAQAIELDRAKLILQDARTKLERQQTLRTSNTASRVQVADAQVVVSNAELALRDAELALDRRTIRSPIAGIVGIIPVETGAYVTSQTAIATIDDRSRIIVDFWAPERFAGQISIGQPVNASSVARPGEAINGEIVAVDNRLDPASRTMQVQAAIPNPDDRLRAGMSFQVSMQFPGDSYAAVDPLAIQWGSDGAFVWQVKDGKSVRTPVRIIQRNTESVLIEADLPEGQMVITEGIHLVREGADVRIAGRQPSPAIAPVAQGG